MPTFTVHDKNSAPDDAKPTLEQAKKQFGTIPNLYGVLAESPQALAAYHAMSDQFQQSSLSKPAQLVVRLDCQPAQRLWLLRRGVLGTRQGRGRRRLHRGGDTRRQADRRRGPRGGAGIHRNCRRTARLGSRPRCRRSWTTVSPSGRPSTSLPGWRKRRCPTTPTTSLALHSTKRSRRSRRRPNARPPTRTDSGPPVERGGRCSPPGPTCSTSRRPYLARNPATSQGVHAESVSTQDGFRSVSDSRK